MIERLFPKGSSLFLLPLLHPVFSDCQFEDYWFNDTAEITHYQLELMRSGEVHPGHAVLIFVTEPFTTRKQIKADPPYTSWKKVQTV